MPGQGVDVSALEVVECQGDHQCLTCAERVAERFGRRPTSDEVVTQARKEISSWGRAPPGVLARLTQEAIRANFTEHVNTTMASDRYVKARMEKDAHRLATSFVDLTDGPLRLGRRKDARGTQISESDQSSVTHSTDPEYDRTWGE